MDEYTGDQVLRWYERMESSILEYSEHVPLVSENDNLVAPFLVSCLIDACGLLDSLFRDLVDESQPVGEKIKKKDKYTIQDYAECFSAKFNLPNMRSILLQAPPRYLSPFNAWSGARENGNYPRLKWWNAYNLLKHDRLTAIKEGTLGITLHALCALHQILARTPQVEMFKLLIRRGWIQIGGYNPAILIEDVQKLGTITTGRFIFQTKMFATPTGKYGASDNWESTEFSENIEDIELHKYQSNQELVKFFGRID